MDKIKSDLLKSLGLTPLLWYRYIDDVLFIWTHGEEKLASFLKDLNNYHPNIKFTHELNKEHIPCLDLNVKLSGNKFSTDLYIKSTDRHNYTSSHPEHTKKSVVYSQALRLGRIYSEEKDFEKHVLRNEVMVFRGDTRKNTEKLKLAKLNFLTKEFSIEKRLKEVFR